MTLKSIEKIIIGFLVVLIVGLIVNKVIINLAPTKLLIESDSLSLGLNAKYKLKAITYPREEKLKYEVEDSSVLTVDKSGNIVTLKEGKTTVKIKSKKEEKSVFIVVSSDEVPITGIGIDEETIEIGTTGKYLIKTKLLPDNASTKNIIIESSNEDVVKVVDGYIKGLKKGFSQITVKIGEFDTEVMDKIIVYVNMKKTDDLIYGDELVSLQVNDTYQLTPLSMPDNVNESDISYIVYDESIANVSTEGLITAKKEGSTSVTAVLPSGLSVSIQIIVSTDDIFASENSISIAKGEVYDLKNNYPRGVEFYSSNIKIATIDSQGIIKAISKGEATITIINTYGQISRIKVIVETDGVPVSSVLISSTDLSIQAGTSYKLSATVLPSNATVQTVTWETSDSRIAIVSGDGIVMGLKDGVALITVYTSNNVTASAKVTVTSVAVSIDSLEISPLNITISKDESYQLTTRMVPSNTTNKDVIWKSSDESIVSVSTNGVVIGNKLGTATIIATSNGLTATSTVTVSENVIQINSVNIVEDSIVVGLGNTIKIPVSYLPIDATNKSFIWTSSNPSIASVSNTGIVTGIKEGTAVLTVKSTNGKQDKVNITVKSSGDGSVTALILNISNVTLQVGQTKQLSVTTIPMNAETSITWISNNAAVSIDSNGLATAVSGGTAIIAAVASNGVIGNATINVPIYSEGPGSSTGRYRKTVTYNGRTYYVYYQDDFGDVQFQSATLREYGCSVISFATAASGFNKTVTPWVGAELVRSRTFSGIKGAFDKVGIRYSGPYFYNSNDNDEAKAAAIASKVRAHLSRGLPVIALVSGDKAGIGKYASDNHFITLMGETPEGKLLLGNCRTEYGDLDELIRYYLTGGRKGFLLVG